jgi:hypothetical protein
MDRKDCRTVTCYFPFRGKDSKLQVDVKVYILKRYAEEVTGEQVRGENPENNIGNEKQGRSYSS